jgi:hypothetical protein
MDLLGSTWFDEYGGALMLGLFVCVIGLVFWKRARDRRQVRADYERAPGVLLSGMLPHTGRAGLDMAPAPAMRPGMVRLVEGKLIVDGQDEEGSFVEILSMPQTNVVSVVGRLWQRGQYMKILAIKALGAATGLTVGAGVVIYLKVPGAAFDLLLVTISAAVGLTLGLLFVLLPGLARAMKQKTSVEFTTTDGNNFTIMIPPGDAAKAQAALTAAGFRSQFT